MEPAPAGRHSGLVVPGGLCGLGRGGGAAAAAGSALAGVVFAEWPASLREEALSFQVLLAHAAVEALAVVVVGQRLNPAVSRLDGESAGEALGGEQLVPVVFAVGLAVLEEEGAVAEQLSAVDTVEAFGVEVLADSVQAIPLDLVSALVAGRGDELLEAVFAVQVALLLHEADVLQRARALAVAAHEVVRAPDLAESRDEGPPDLLVTGAAQRHPGAADGGGVQDTAASDRSGRAGERASLGAPWATSQLGERFQGRGETWRGGEP